MKLVSMERTAAEKKKAEEQVKPTMTGPDFPWGLSINLADRELKKVGIKELPEIGDEYMLVAIAKVTRVSANASEDDANRSVEFQLTEMALEENEIEEAGDDGDEGTKDVRAVAEKLYPKKK